MWDQRGKNWRPRVPSAGARNAREHNQSPISPQHWHVVSVLEWITAPKHISTSSVAVHALTSLRCARLPGDWDHVHGDPDEPRVCSLYAEEMYSADESGMALDGDEHRWRHIEHLLL